MSILSSLAVKHGTDKWAHHFYTEHYHQALSHLQKKKFNLLEIGIGGYEYPDRGGGSLRMWAEYFPKARVVGMDYYDKSALPMPGNVIICQGDQSSEEQLLQVCRQHGPFAVILDDGSHQVQHQLKSFEVLFPLLPDGGIYIIEDTESSYWPSHGGSKNIGYPHSTINSFMRKVHEMQYRSNGLPKTAFTDIIESVQFFNNIIIVKKGYNA